jgi:acetyl esterase/lipase
VTDPFLGGVAQPRPAVVRADGSRWHPGCVYAAAAGYRALELDLWVPAGPGPAPLVVWVHGGAFMVGHRHGFPPALREGQLVDALLAAGLAVASIEYRHAREAVFPAQLHDAQAAVRWLRHHADGLGLDPARVGIGGESAGGHIAALVAFAAGRPELQGALGVRGPGTEVSALVDWFGVSDLDAMPEFEVPPEVAARLAPEDLVAPEDVLLAGVDPAVRAVSSPLPLVGPGAPPTLLVHGDADTVVPLEQSVRLHEALQAAGASSRLVVVPGADHGFTGAADPDALVADTVEHFRAELTPR